MQVWFDFTLTGGSDFKHRSKSSASISVRRPRLRAGSCPVLISSYIAVRPMPDWAHASAILWASAFSIVVSSRLAGIIPVNMRGFYIN
jgi:hypothetical protein